MGPGTGAATRLTFACCAKYGTLEEGSLRLAESLRRYGGELANARIVAVTPRHGPWLRPSTLEALERLGVD